MSGKCTVPAVCICICLCVGSSSAGVGGLTRGASRHPQELRQQTVHATSDMAGVGEQAIRRMLTYKKELELNDAQDTSLMSIRTELMKNLTVVLNNLIQCQGEYAALVEAENPDFKKIREKARELTTLETYVTALSVDAFDKAYAVLSEKQKNEWAVLAKKRREEMEMRMLQQMNAQRMPGQ